MEDIEDTELTIEFTKAIQKNILDVCSKLDVPYSDKNLQVIALILADVGMLFVYNGAKSVDQLEDVAQMINGRAVELIDALKVELKLEEDKKKEQA